MKYTLTTLLLSILLLTGCSEKNKEEIRTPSEIITIYNAAALENIGDSPDFGVMESSDDAITKIFKIQNTGDAATSEAPVASIVGDAAFKILLQQGCSTVLAKTKTCNVRVSFDPKNKQPNNYTATLRLGSSPLMEIPLLAVVEAAEVSPISSIVFLDGSNNISSGLNMGDFNNTQSLQKIITIKNNGSSALPLSSATLSNSNHFSMLNQCANKTLSAGASCSVRITFSSSGKIAGVYSTNLSFAQAVLGISAQVIVSPPPAPNYSISFLENSSLITNLNFGQVGENQSIQKIISVKNNGPTASGLLSASLSNNNGISIVLNQCLNKNLLVNQSCSVRLSFNSSGKNPGNYSASLIFGNASIPISAEFSSPAVGPVLLKNMAEDNVQDSNISNIHKINNKVIFSNYTDSEGLWSTDGTSAGTIKLSAIPGTNLMGVDYFSQSIDKAAAELNGFLYLSVQDGNNESNYERSLWRTDGTVAGTSVVLNNFNVIRSLTKVGNYIYFLGKNLNENLGNGFQLSIWRTNGTITEKVLTSTIPQAIVNASESHLLVLGNSGIYSFDLSNNTLSANLVGSLLPNSCDYVVNGTNQQYSFFRCISTIFGLATYLVGFDGLDWGYRQVPQLNQHMAADNSGNIYFTISPVDRLMTASLVSSSSSGSHNGISLPSVFIGAPVDNLSTSYNRSSGMARFGENIYLSVKDSTTNLISVKKIINQELVHVAGDFSYVNLEINASSFAPVNNHFYFLGTNSSIGSEYWRDSSPVSSFDIFPGNELKCFYQEGENYYPEPWFDEETCLSLGDPYVLRSTPKGNEASSKIIFELNNKIITPLKLDNAVGEELYIVN